MQTVLKFELPDIKAAIIEAARKQGFKVVGDVTINIVSRGGEYGQSEYKELGNIEVTCTKIEKPYDGGGPGGRD